MVGSFPLFDVRWIRLYEAHVPLPPFLYPFFSYLVGSLSILPLVVSVFGPLNCLSDGVFLVVLFAQRVQDVSTI